MSELNENELMLAIREGELHHLSTLFELYQIPLFNFFLRLTNDRVMSEDFVQDVFIRVLKYRHTYRGEGTFKGWIFNLARNICMDHFRKTKREINGIEEQTLAQIPDENWEGHLESDQAAHYVQLALSRLTPDYREVLILSRYHDMKYEEIATMLNCSVAAVKVRVHRAMKALRTHYFTLTREQGT
ncbi:MAG: RNA polymerase sigma factor [Rhodothermia bacterium]|nr:RNA polymerase sigma factor [Rhodothermia bacterium]